MHCHRDVHVAHGISGLHHSLQSLRDLHSHRPLALGMKYPIHTGVLSRFGTNRYEYFPSVNRFVLLCTALGVDCLFDPRRRRSMTFHPLRCGSDKPATPTRCAIMAGPCMGSIDVPAAALLAAALA